MVRIRCFEERLKDFYDYRGFFQQSAEEEARSADDLLTCVSYEFGSEGMIGGAVHLYIGQEAVAVGVCAALRDTDWVASTHRGHGHAIAKGADLKRTLAELMGRETGHSRGCGGSMHIFAPEIGLLGGNGIVGAGMPIALGPAFAAKYRGEDGVSVAFFGDGAANQGTFNESINLAAIWKLPVLFVCENNLWANATPYEIAFHTHDIADRASGYGIPGMAVDGQDVLAMYDAAKTAVDRARAGDGPTLIEAKTYRFEGHCGASSGHQDPETCAEWMKRDPIAQLTRRL
ncbi:MAG: thiamine pyrophosphate-dependent dehydrogenase E1 component subunit alpha, partial [Armatimonadetes bacterium]|nr:thiamine pyrophosphate-dependent dehydrogenase E1 component subunit alpha [Armatimonadota bacterium]